MPNETAPSAADCARLMQALRSAKTSSGAYAIERYARTGEHEALLALALAALAASRDDAISWRGIPVKVSDAVGEGQVLLAASREAPAGAVEPMTAAEMLSDLEDIRREVFGDVGSEPNIYADYDNAIEAERKMCRAIEGFRALAAFRELSAAPGGGIEAETVMGAWPLRFSYRNHRGEIADRCVYPIGLRFGVTEWHPEPQWLLRALDVDKGAEREFAMLNMGASPPPPQDDGLRERCERLEAALREIETANSYPHDRNTYSACANTLSIVRKALLTPRDGGSNA